MSTETATAATWFGIRTILDLFPQSDLHCSETPLRGDAPLLYVTKRGWEKVREVLNSRSDGYNPLIVFETGGRGGSISAESWVAQRNGIILASAESALGWFGATGTEMLSLDQSRETRVKQTRENWVQWSQRSGANVKDDRGRIFQNAQILTTLQNNPHPSFLYHPQGLLFDLNLYGITLGDLGIIFWTKSEQGEWLGPQWCFSAELSRQRSDGPKAIEDAEMRNGLGCGDVCRAGFCAALMLDNLEAGPTRPLNIALANTAVAWAHWFGTSKIRFFSLIDYLNWLKEKTRAAQVVANIRQMVKTKFNDRQPLSLAADGFELVVKIEPAVENKQLHGDLTAILKQLEIWKQDRESWNKRIDDWRRARDIELA